MNWVKEEPIIKEQYAVASNILAHKKDLIMGTAIDINQEQQDAANNVVLKLTYKNLVRFAYEGKIVPCLTPNWEYLYDNHLKFSLMHNAHFSDVSSLTDKDIKSTYNMAKNSFLAQNLANAISLELAKHGNEVYASLASVPLAIQPKATYDSGMDRSKTRR